MKNFSACLWLCFLQTRANSEQAFEAKHNRNRQVASAIFQRGFNFLLTFIAAVFELCDLVRRVAIRKAAGGNFTN